MTTMYAMEDQREAERLAGKVDAASWVAEFIPGPQPAGARVLDVGTGPGTIAAEFQGQHPDSMVVAFDLSPGRLAHGADPARSRVRSCCGSAVSLPFRDATFDLVYSRLLLEHVAQPEVAVAEMHRVLRPGGRVLLFDLDGQLMWHDPPDAELMRYIDAAVAGLRAFGFDPYVGRRLYGLVRSAGFVDIEMSVRPYHLIAGRVSASERQRWELKLDILKPALAQIYGDPGTARKAVSAFLAFLDRPDTLTYSVAFAVSGVRPHPGPRAVGGGV